MLEANYYKGLLLDSKEQKTNIICIRWQKILGASGQGECLGLTHSFQKGPLGPLSMC